MPWFPLKPLSTKTLSIKIFLKDEDCRVILPTNCIKKLGILRECAGYPKFSESKPILALKATKLKSMKESAGRYGIATRHLIQPLKNCVCLKWNSIFTDYEVCQPS